MSDKTIITLICHPDGLFSVGNGFSQGTDVFDMREKADACAKQLQTQLGGPDNAKIIIHDLTKGGA